MISVNRVISLCLALIFISISTSTGQWSGSIKVIDGIEYISNPERGLWDDNPKIKLSIKPVLTIPKPPTKTYKSFGWIQDIATDKTGIIYACDQRHCVIYVFDKNGEYFYTFGDQKNKDFEFKRPISTRIAKEDFIYILDDLSYRISVFKPDGNFAKHIYHEDVTFGFEITNSDKLLLRHFSSEYTSIITVYNLSGKIVGGFGEPLQLAADNGLGEPIFASNSFRLWNNDIVVIHYLNPYKILFSNNEKLYRVVSRDSPIFTPPEVVETSWGTKHIVQRSYIWDVFHLPNNNFFTFIRDSGINYKKTHSSQEFKTHIDIYDENGKFLKSYRWDWEKYGLIKHVDNEGFFYTNLLAEKIPGIQKLKVSFK